MKLIRIISVLAVLPILAACNTVPDPSEQFKGQTAAQIYFGGEQALAKGSYTTAKTHFEGLDALYPFSDYSQQAQLDIIYAYFQSGDEASSAAAAERYIHLYPRSAHVDYAYYMKGVADFEQDRGWEQRYFPTPLPELDPGTARTAYDDFNSLITLFPSSVYAADARLHMIYLRNLFAAYELNVAHFYIIHHAYVAAINRANYVLENFNGTPSQRGALIVLVQSYTALNMPEMAQQANNVLQYNYPGTVIPPINNNNLINWY